MTNTQKITGRQKLGGSGAAIWGSITGTLSDQTDLQNVLNLKYDASNPAGYITASSSNTLTNKSGNISQWTNDSGYITASSVNTLTNKSGNISQWTNDAGYITSIAGAVTSVTGTNNRITSTGGSTPQIDISGSYIGQASITTLGTISTGTWQGASISTSFTDAKIKTVAGTSNRITIAGTATDPTFDISGSYVGQSSITTLGTITTGTWNGTAITDGNLATSYIKADGSRALAANWDMGAFQAKNTMTGLGVTQTETNGFYLRNSTAAANNAQQISPAITWEGQGWGTTGSASQRVNWRAYVLPVQGAANPTSELHIQSAVNAGAYSDRTVIDSSGGITTTGAISGGFLKSTNAGSTALFQGNSGNGLQIYNSANSNRSWIFASSQSPDKMGLGNNTTPDCTLDVLVLALNTTQLITAGVQVSNTTAATVSQNQISPFFAYKAAGWKTNATAASELVIMRSYLVTSTGAADPTGYITWESNVNGGSYSTNLLTLGSAGNVAIGQTPVASSWLSIKAGTTAASQINLAISTAPSSPNAGDMWYETNAFRGRQTSNTITFSDITNVQRFLAGGSTTWTKPTGAKWVHVVVIAPGGAGGSGRKGAAGSVRCGGGGGGAGGQMFFDFDAADLPSTVTVSVPAAGTGGTAISASDTNGNNGATMTSLTSFGPYLAVGPGNPGNGGSNAAGAGGSGGTSFGITSTANGGSASTTGAGAGGAGTSGNSFQPTGGGSGGGITSGDALGTFGIMGFLGLYTNPSNNYGNNFTDGQAGAQAGALIFGTGGNGGNSSKTTNATAGGAGGSFGGGGGGGGAALNAVGNSGKGGDGGPGIVIVTTYF